MSDNQSSSSTSDLRLGASSISSGGFNRTTLASAAVLAAGLAVGGFATGDGLVRMKASERSVTVRGVAERNVTADLAVWTVSFSDTASDLQTAQAATDSDAVEIRDFFRKTGFADAELTPAGINVSSYTDKGMIFYTVRQRMVLRSNDIAKVQKAVRDQADLVRAGVVMEDGSGINYTFTKLNAIKPDMVAEATRDARAAAEKFATDSGASVGSIRQATQGYFEVGARDGEAEGWGIGDTPYKKVRVVTTIDFALD